MVKPRIKSCRKKNTAQGTHGPQTKQKRQPRLDVTSVPLRGRKQEALAKLGTPGGNEQATEVQTPTNSATGALYILKWSVSHRVSVRQVGTVNHGEPW